MLATRILQQTRYTTVRGVYIYPRFRESLEHSMLFLDLDSPHRVRLFAHGTRTRAEVSYVPCFVAAGDDLIGRSLVF